MAHQHFYPYWPFFIDVDLPAPQYNSLLPLADLATESAKIPLGPLFNVMLQLRSVFLPVFNLDFLEIPRLPVKTHQTTDEQLRTVFGGFGKGLVKKGGVANGAVDYAVKDVRKGLALRS